MTLKEAIAHVNASGTHVVVPVEPTEEIECAWWLHSSFSNFYRDMLSASLTHSEGGA